APPLRQVGEEVTDGVELVVDVAVHEAEGLPGAARPLAFAGDHVLPPILTVGTRRARSRARSSRRAPAAGAAGGPARGPARAGAGSRSRRAAPPRSRAARPPPAAAPARTARPVAGP